MKKVVICGAGIGGLTVAHELANRGFEVHVYERNEVTGGLARSTYVTLDGHEYPVEYSWRVYGAGYKNLLRILKEIPQQHQPTKTILHNLVEIVAYLFPRFDRPGFNLGGRTASTKRDWRFSRRDYLRMAHKILTCATMCPARMNAMDDIRWSDYCSDLSDEARKYLVTLWGPALGMDPTHMSFPVVGRFITSLVEGFVNKVSPLYLMNAPTNDAWFDQWVTFLESHENIHVHTNHEVEEITLINGRATGIRVRDKQSDTSTDVRADEVVCSLPVEQAALLLQDEKLERLASTAHQVQLSVQIFLDEELNYGTDENLVLYLPDSPWAIIIEPEALIWDKTYSTDERVKSVWSVGVCQTDVPGIVHKKPFVECTPEEVEDEVMAQIERSYTAHGITMADGTPVDRSRVIHFYMWDSFRFDEEQKRIVTWEPKFSNNAGGFKDQPATAGSIENLSFASAWTRTQRFIFSMEAAAEAGIACANHLLKKEGKRRKNIIPFRHYPLVFAPFVWFDRLLFTVRIPHFMSFLKYII